MTSRHIGLCLAKQSVNNVDTCGCASVFDIRRSVEMKSLGFATAT